MQRSQDAISQGGECRPELFEDPVRFYLLETWDEAVGTQLVGLTVLRTFTCYLLSIRGFPLEK